MPPAATPDAACRPRSLHQQDGAAAEEADLVTRGAPSPGRAAGLEPVGGHHDQAGGAAGSGLEDLGRGLADPDLRAERHPAAGEGPRGAVELPLPGLEETPGEVAQV